MEPGALVLTIGAAGTLALADLALPWLLGLRRARAIRRVLDVLFLAGFVVTTAAALASSWHSARMLSGLEERYCRTHAWESRCR